MGRDKAAERKGGWVRPEDVDPEATLAVLRVPNEWNRWRVDQVVQATFSRMSRTRAQNVVQTGAYSETGTKLKPGDRLHTEDIILLYRPPFEEPDVPIECAILYEDDALLAVHKPAGLPVHPTARYRKKTVITLLHAARPEQFLALCHRIDRETSGVLLLAKNIHAERFIKKALESHKLVHKRYLAITWGIPKPQQGRITHALKLDEHHPTRVRMRIADGEPDAMASATQYEVLATSKHYQDVHRNYALVACTLETGRQHQIRIHLATLGFPLVGDKLYGPYPELFTLGADGLLTQDDYKKLELPRHALHAHKLSIPNPSDPTRQIEITAPMPSDLQHFWHQQIPI